jgi:hypothetical protein
MVSIMIKALAKLSFTKPIGGGGSRLPVGKRPVCSLQAAFALPVASCDGKIDQGFRLSIYSGTLRFDSRNKVEFHLSQITVL